jgi:hypothetical protein
VTKLEARRCKWCRRPFEAAVGQQGRPRLYCRRSCRQRDYEARRRREELGLAEGELVMARAQLDDLADKLYVLEAAVEDVERDLAESSEGSDYRAATAWLLDAARPLLEWRPGQAPAPTDSSQ